MSRNKKKLKQIDIILNANSNQRFHSVKLETICAIFDINSVIIHLISKHSIETIVRNK